MKVDLNIDTEELEERVVQKVVKALRPLMKDLPSDEDTLLSVKRLAEYLQMSEKWVYERIQFNEMPYCKIGRSVRFKKSDIDEWVDTLKTPAVNPLSSAIKVVK